MTTDLTLLAYACVLTWVMVFSASFVKARAWTPGGAKLAMGNRDAMLEPTGAIARAERAGRNMQESLPLFIGLVAAAHLGGRHDETVDLGAQLFFWARVAYWPIYVAGVPYVRTAVWYVAIAGLGLIFTALL